MTKYKTSQQTKLLLLLLGFTEKFQPPELSTDYFFLFTKCHPGRSTGVVTNPGQALAPCHTNAAAPAMLPWPGSSSAFPEPGKLQVVSSPSSFFSVGIKDGPQLRLSVV